MAYHVTTSLALMLTLIAGCDLSTDLVSDGPSPAPVETDDALPREAGDEQHGQTSSSGSESIDEAELGQAEGQVPLSADDPRFALLIACTTYDHLSEDADLRGPTNDTQLMRKLLIDHFGMSQENVQELSEDVGSKACRPLKANIAREFRRLTRTVNKGDQVVVFFSGHGCQQPDDASDSQNDPEPDGFDEVLLPADTNFDMDPEATKIPNAISDDELREWLTKLRDKGASVWVILDSCHSGTATRGREVRKQIRPETLLSPAALAKVKPQSQSRGATAPTSSHTDVGEQGGLVAIYAAQPHEPTYELPLPDEKSGQWQGLLTYTLAKVLLESERPLTYTELVQRIHAEYITMGRYGPTPLVEGGDKDREVLGADRWPERTRLVLTSDRLDQLSLNAGRLHGLSEGSILAVYPPRGGAADADEPLGHVRIEKAQAAMSFVSPCKFDESPLVEDLPIGGVCELVQLDYGDLRLKVGIADDSETDKHIRRREWIDALQAISEQPNTLVEYVEDASQADWLIENFVLDRAELRPAQASADPPRFGDLPIDETLQPWLEEHLNHIARARNLIRLAGVTPTDGKKGFLSNLLRRRPLAIRPELVRLDDAQDEEGDVVTWRADGLKLQAEDLVGLKVTNTGRVQADITVLFVDSNFGIDVLFPPPATVTDNRIPPGESLFIGPMQVQGNSVGLEHLLLIVNKGEGQPLDFTWLGQPSLEQARSSSPSGAPDSLGSPLGKLFQNAMYAGGTTRGLKMADTDDVILRALSWETVNADDTVNVFP